MEPKRKRLDDYTTMDFTEFVVTGVETTGKRFKLTYNAYNGWPTANGINLYRGSVWGVLKSTGKRILLKRSWNR